MATFFLWAEGRGGGVRGPPFSTATLLRARMDRGLSTWPRRHSFSHGWAQMVAQMEGRGLVSLTTSRERRKSPVAMAAR